MSQRCKLLGLVALAVGLALTSQPAQAQQNAGVFVDAEGVVQKRVVADPTGQLIRQRIAAAEASLEPDLARASEMRKISLTRLENELRKNLAINRGPSEAMKYLAGLTRVEYVFLYPESGDIVIAGPAEGWAHDLTGRVRGMKTGRPVLMLEDLAVALRAYPPGGRKGPVIGCSIDPTQEGLSRMQQFLVKFGPHATPRDTQFIVQSLRDAMGLQTVSVIGVAGSTHFAQVMVEADYRMKLIGIGLENPPVKLTSFVDRASASQVSRNALQRWYFAPNYECVRVAQDGQAAQLVGDGVRLIGEDELVTEQGGRRQSGTGNRASQQFVDNFTRVYPELAEKSPVYAQLRNLIDLAVTTAFLQQRGWYEKAGFECDVLGDEQKFPVEVHNVPQQVETVVTSLWKGNRLMTPIGGGVTIDPMKALTSANLLADEEGQVQATRETIKPQGLADGQWWWD